MANQPDRFALFILGPEEKRVEVAEDTLIPNAVTVTLNKEDHTLGNLLRHAILSIPGVLFSGYRVPHPLEPRTVIKIQTDGSLTPLQALRIGCDKVITTTGSVRSSFKAQCQLFEDRQGLGDVAMARGLGDASGAGAAEASYGTSGQTYAYGDPSAGGDDGVGYIDI